MMMLGPIGAIAFNTVRELVRSKLLYTLLLFAGLLIAGSIAIAQLTMGGWERIITDVSLAAIEMVGLLVAVLIGVSVVAGEVEKRTIYPTLAKPVSRGAFLFGRYAGLSAILALMTGIMLALLWLTLSLSGYALSGTALFAASLILIELLLMASAALFFSSFTTPILASAFSLSLFLIGHLLSDLRAFAERSKNPAVRAFVEGAARVLPDLELLNLKGHAANALPVGGHFVAASAAYGLAYAGLLLVLSIAVFRRRDLK
jgi:ABC-type transport system involved in multi-copper enzyme maturation permease subunit